ncbi:MAG: hypothetical protein GF381_00500, partial [Candidatus Pacebacteria bacterium]|nr:hypothetical protein [Candidatus Paceibacterota bacterium]
MNRERWRSKGANRLDQELCQELYDLLQDLIDFLLRYLPWFPKHTEGLGQLGKLGKSEKSDPPSSERNYFPVSDGGIVGVLRELVREPILRNNSGQVEKEQKLLKFCQSLGVLASLSGGKIRFGYRLEAALRRALNHQHAKKVVRRLEKLLFEQLKTTSSKQTHLEPAMLKQSNPEPAERRLFEINLNCQGQIDCSVLAARIIELISRSKAVKDWEIVLVVVS